MDPAGSLQASMSSHHAGEKKRILWRDTVAWNLDVLGWNKATLVCLLGGLLAVASALWFASLIWRPLFCAAFDLVRPGGFCAMNGPDLFWFGSLVIAPMGIVVGAVFMALSFGFLIQQRRQNERRRGMVTVRDLRPGDVFADYGTQALTCRLEIRIEGMDTICADYWTGVGPLDVPMFVEGATFACEVSPRPPEMVLLWLLADPDAGELTGRCLNFLSSRYPMPNSSKPYRAMTGWPPPPALA